MEELEPILSEIRSRKRVALGFGIMAVGFGVAAPFIPAQDSGGWAMYAIMSFLILFGGFWLIYGLVPAAWSGGISIMHKHPDRIVWFYIGVQDGWLHLYLENGKHYQYMIASGGHQGVWDYLSRVAPHSQQGYDFEYLRLFQDDPSLLRKGNS